MMNVAVGCGEGHSGGVWVAGGGEGSPASPPAHRRGTAGCTQPAGGLALHLRPAKESHPGPPRQHTRGTPAAVQGALV